MVTTLKEVKKEMYENMKNRYNDFLWDEERYIVENLESVEDESWIIKYTEAEACNIVCQTLDWICMTDTENASWEAWYIRWYEVALKEILHEIESSNNKLITANRINYLLTN